MSCSEALRREVGESEAWLNALNQETLKVVRAKMDESAFARAREDGRTLTAEEAVAMALDSLGSNETQR